MLRCEGRGGGGSSTLALGENCNTACRGWRLRNDGEQLQRTNWLHVVVRDPSTVLAKLMFSLTPNAS